MSCYLLLHNNIKEFITKDNANKETQIWMGHGDSDPLVRPGWGLQSAKQLKNMGFNVDIKMYK